GKAEGPLEFEFLEIGGGEAACVRGHMTRVGEALAPAGPAVVSIGRELRRRGAIGGVRGVREKQGERGEQQGRLHGNSGSGALFIVVARAAASGLVPTLCVGMHMWQSDVCIPTQSVGTRRW